MKALLYSILICVAAAEPRAVWGQVTTTGRATRDRKGVTLGAPAKFGSYAAQARLAEKAIKDATQLIQEEKWFLARRQLDSADGYRTDSQIKAITELYKQIEKQGQLELAAARQHMASGDYRNGLEKLRQIQSRFGWLPSGQAARKAVRQARRDPKISAAMGDAKAQKLLSSLDKRIDANLSPADQIAKPGQKSSQLERTVKIRALNDQMLMEVIATMQRIAKSYNNTPTAMVLEDELQTLMEDDDFAGRYNKLLLAEKAEDLLKMADMYAKAGRADLARTRLEKVIKQYPNTEQAKLAATKLGQLQGQ